MTMRYLSSIANSAFQSIRSFNKEQSRLARILHITKTVTYAVSFSIFHSWFKMRWYPGSRKWLDELDVKIRSKISHNNNGEYVTVPFNNEQHQIWTVSVDGDKPDAVPIVLIHGFLGGSNMFLMNIDALAEQRNVILIDLPGFAKSSRPNFRTKYVDGWWVESTGEDVENFYVETLELWAKEMNLEKFILLGHSFGAYLSSAYSFKYPGRIAHLVLADAWGFGARPSEADRRLHRRARWVTVVAKLYSKMNAFTPLKVFGPLAPVIFRRLRKDLYRKFDAHFEDDTFANYLYACNTCDKSTGETGFYRLSFPVAWAKFPLANRCQDWEPDLDVTFIYGARSWCFNDTYAEIAFQRHGAHTDRHSVQGAGHHPYADQPVAFNDLLLKVGEAVDQGRRPNVSERTTQRHNSMHRRRRNSSISLEEGAQARPQRTFSMSEMLTNQQGKGSPVHPTADAEASHVEDSDLGIDNGSQDIQQ